VPPEAKLRYLAYDEDSEPCYPDAGGVWASFVGSVSADAEGDVLVFGTGEAVLDEHWDQIGQQATADNISPDIYGTREHWSKLAWAGHWSDTAP
jgi:hypothetical protein